jgi:glycosyltransferase involved in cell wall biosynthesis
MNLSVCILTHNRPVLFRRAISSLLKNKSTYDFEIIVNNDTSDIEEVYSDDITVRYMYESCHDISNIYEMLLDVSSSDYIYYLEDDDYIKPTFFDQIDFDYDINHMQYTSLPHIQHLGVKHAIEIQKLNAHKKDVHTYAEFLDGYNNEYFQLGQILFNKHKIIQFPKGNNIHNDFKLFTGFAPDTTIKYIDKQTWVQTTDGGDNISFEHLNTDDRFKK